MAESLVLVKTKRSCKLQDGDWFYYLKLKLYDVSRRCVERHYIEDLSRDRLCFFKVEFVPEKQGVYLAYKDDGYLRVYCYHYRTRELTIVGKMEVPLKIDLDDIDTHCFMNKDGLLAFARTVLFVDFATASYISLGDYNSSLITDNAIPVSFTGACYRNSRIYVLINGTVSVIKTQMIFPAYSYFYPLGNGKLIRIGGRQHSTYGYNQSFTRRKEEKRAMPEMEVLDVRNGQLIESYYMPEDGIVNSAVRRNDCVYFLWQTKNYAMRLNVNTLSMTVCFDGDYFMECFKVVYLHSKRKLRLPLGLIREVCSFLAESKRIARAIAARGL